MVEADDSIPPDPTGPGTDDERFARNMLRRREERGLSQADLVRLLREGGWHGVHQTTISRIEKLERPVRLGEARAISSALGVDMSQLLLTPEDSQLAADLACARERLEHLEQVLKNRTVDYYRATRELMDVYERASEAGFRPGLPVTSWRRTTSNGSVADELAIARQCLEEVSPEKAVRWGKWQYKYLQSIGDEPGNLQVDAEL